MEKNDSFATKLLQFCYSFVKKPLNKVLCRHFTTAFILKFVSVIQGKIADYEGIKN